MGTEKGRELKRNGIGREWNGEHRVNERITVLYVFVLETPLGFLIKCTFNKVKLDLLHFFYTENCKCLEVLKFELVTKRIKPRKFEFASD